MINPAIFKEIILEYQHNIPKIHLITRDISLEPDLNYIFVGLRRAGKSFMMFTDIQSRLNKGKITIQDVLYINFEDERLLEIEANDLRNIIFSYEEMFDNKNPLIYLDEIQNVNGWEKYVRRLADTGYHVWVTGSNAKMLSHDMATILGGRYIIKYIPTFSFREFLKYEDIGISRNWKVDKAERIQLKKKLNVYFYFGGFAETFHLVDKRSWINSLYQKILFGDIIARNGYRNDRALVLLARKLAQSVKQPTTHTRLLNIIKSTGTVINRHTIGEYLENLNKAYLTFSLSNYKHSLSERATEGKHYYSDNGLLNNFLIDPNTSLLENLVAIELNKKFFHERNEEVFYYRNGIEIDFYVPLSKLAIQVAYDISNQETFLREAEALHKFSKTIELSRFVIITLDETSEEVVTYKSIQIQVITLLNFLIEGI